MPEIISTPIARLGYDAFAHELDVIFSSGRQVRYFGVPAAVFRRLVDAPDKATFFSASILDRYAAEEVMARPKRADWPTLRRSA